MLDDSQIIEKLGLNEAPEEVQKVSLNQVKHIVMARVDSAVEAIMTDEQYETYSNLSDDSPEGLWQWLDENVPESRELAESILSDYFDELNDRVDRLK